MYMEERGNVYKSLMGERCGQKANKRGRWRRGDNWSHDDTGCLTIRLRQNVVITSV
jgi:hypothetical protein